MSLNNEPILFVALGSPHGDDRIGWLLADALANELASHSGGRVVVRKAASPADLLDWTGAADRWMICDACVDSTDTATAGRWVRWRWPDCPVERFARSGTHDLTLEQVLELMTTLGTLPRQVDVVGIMVSGTREACDGSTRGAPVDAVDPALTAAIPVWTRTLIEEWDA